jgi:D-glycero-D-manno-heptose 1,7-bisphosphate phosphatase
MQILEGVDQATNQLKLAGFELIVVTNQPDVARGTTSKEVVEQINRYLAERLGIDEFRTCYHDSKDGCNCRKPLPGAILDSAKSRGIDLSHSFMVGDRWRDIEAGQAAGVKTVFIDNGYDEKQPTAYDFKASSLLYAVPYILGVKL